MLEDGNTKLERLLADSMLDNAALKDLLGKKGWRPRGNGKLLLIWWMPAGWANGGRVKPSASAAWP
jgi:putative transposase